MGAGASTKEWTHFEIVLGLGEDLLPVVSAGDAEISENSTMTAIGKTPSLYNWKRKVVGFPKWTKLKATPERIADWSTEPDYGICVQTRRCRAIDIDTEDRRTVNRILRRLRSDHPHLQWVTREREGSARVLLPFILESDLYKHVLPVTGGMVEILGTGQQFVACGTHQPSGLPYKWRGGLPSSLPVLDEMTFDLVWAMLTQTFATGRGQIARAPRDPSDISLTGGSDDIVDWLAENDHVLDVGRDNRIFIECPFSDDHTVDSGPTATAYFPAGTGGYEQGKFVCLHAHCQKRENADYLEELGYAQEQFEDLSGDGPGRAPDPAQPKPAATPSTKVVDIDPATYDHPRLRRDKKTGEPLATGDNITQALSHPGFCGYRLAFDTFLDELMWAPVEEPHNKESWRALGDEHYMMIRIALERRAFKPMGKEMLRDAIFFTARQRTIDAGIAWLDRLEWDGTPRVETFLERYFKAPPSEYAKACSKYVWSAHAGRVLSPGCQADMAMILRGDQGVRKTTGIKAIAPGPQHYCEIDLTERDDDLSRKLRGKLVGELEELRGLYTRHGESIKAFVTRTHENWVPKFKEFQTKFPRRLVFWGSTNMGEFLGDETGERRWLPIEVCTNPGEKVDTDAIARDRDQLWAEGAAMYREHGVHWSKAERLAKAEHDKFKMLDAWHYQIRDWLMEEDIDGLVRGEKPLDLTRVALGAVGMSLSAVTHGHKLRVARVLRALGYERQRSGRGDWLYVRPDLIDG